MKILGIETSCDETAAAVLELTNNGSSCRLMSNVVASSADLHIKYGGVVPEIAARSQLESIIPVIDQALEDAFPISKHETLNPKSENSALSSSPSALFDPWDQIDGIAVTNGAGLGGSLLIGVMTARTLAIIKKKPLYSVNHIEGHVYANFITETSPLPTTNYQLPTTIPTFPILALIVSGGHTQLVLFKDHFDYQVLGQTRDDAIGEAFDKVAKIIGLPYPGGPSIAEAAKQGDPLKLSLPKAKMPGKYDFSFSGLKTAVLRLAQNMCGKSYDFPSNQLPGLLNGAQKANIAASFQRIAVETVVDKTITAYEEYKPKSVVIAGGVAANQELRQQLSKRLPVTINYPDLKLCTDNAAMIAALGCYKAMLHKPVVNPYKLSISPNISM